MKGADLEIPEFSGNLSEALYLYQQQRHLCDVLIITTNGYIPAHRVVLLANSPFFSSPDSDFYIDFDNDDVKAVIRFLYTGKLSVTECNIQSLVKICSILQVSAAVPLCENYLRQIDKSASARNGKNDKDCEGLVVNGVVLTQTTCTSRQDDQQTRVDRLPVDTISQNHLPAWSTSSDVTINNQTDAQCENVNFDKDLDKQTSISFDDGHPIVCLDVENFTDSLLHQKRVQIRVSPCVANEGIQNSQSAVGNSRSCAVPVESQIMKEKNLQSISAASKMQKSTEHEEKKDGDCLDSHDDFETEALVNEKSAAREPDENQMAETSSTIDSSKVEIGASNTTDKPVNTVAHSEENMVQCTHSEGNMAPHRKEKIGTLLDEDSRDSFSSDATILEENEGMNDNEVVPQGDAIIDSETVCDQGDTCMQDRLDRNGTVEKSKSVIPSSQTEDISGVSQTSSQENVEIRIFACYTCKKEFTDPYELIEHRKEQHPPEPRGKNRFACDLCDYRSNYRKRIAEHKFKKHSVPLDLKEFDLHRCQFENCEYTSLMKANILSHVKNIHGSSDFLCVECGKRFKTSAQRKRHMMYKHHAFDRPKFVCSTCGKEYSDKSHLKQHVKAVHLKEVQKKLCHLCPYSGASVFLLTNHLLNVHNIQPPETYKIYRCDKCDFFSIQKKAFIRHEAQHQGERKFKCAICDKAFITMGDKTGHEKRHRKEYLYCEYEGCDYFTIDKHTMRDHINSAHMDKDYRPHKCHLCDHSCKLKGNLNKHLQNKHGLNVMTMHKRRKIAMETGQGFKEIMNTLSTFSSKLQIEKSVASISKRKDKGDMQ